MAFTDYRNFDAVVKRHKLRFTSGQVARPLADAPPFSDYFRAELDLSLNYLTPGRSSEIGAGEILLFPILREVWKTYREQLSLFTHEGLVCDADLSGVPDYFICRVSEYGRIPEPPYLLVAEAKLDDFDRAWGQCLAEMLAAQRLNATPDRPVYGVASNGKAWEFGVLLGNVFTQQQTAYAVADLDRVGQALHSVLAACRDLALTHPSPAAV